VTGLLLATAPLAVGAGASQPALSSLLSRLARSEEQGGTLGLGESAAALGRILGPEAGTFTFGRFWQAFPYLVGGLLMLLAALVSSTLRRAAESVGVLQAQRSP